MNEIDSFIAWASANPITAVISFVAAWIVTGLLMKIANNTKKTNNGR